MALQEGVHTETCFVSISIASGSDVEFAARTTSVSIDQGDKDIDQIATLSGGRMVVKIPQGITSITLEGHCADIDSTAGTGYSQMFQSGTWITVEPLIQAATRQRDLFRVAFLWTDDAAATSASATTAAATNSYRWYANDCYCTSCKPSFTDGRLKFTLGFKVPAFDTAGTALIYEHSGDATALAALGAYT